MEGIKIDRYFASYKGKKCLILGSKGFIGEKLRVFAKEMQIDLVTLNIGKKNDTSGSDIEIESGNERAMEEGFLKAKNKLGAIDYILCNFDLDTLREEEVLSCENWDICLRDWCLNYFLLLKFAVKHLQAGPKRHIVYFNSAYGYTGEGEGEGCLLAGGNLLEAICSSGITGMMTSIARSIIPKGYTVNGIALGNDLEDKWPRIQWALNLWISGMGEYSCGEIYRIY